MTDRFAIEALLPQTQCRQCGYRDCADYARAIAEGERHNRCPAGGDAVIEKLSALLDRPVLPLDETCGVHVAPEVAEIDEKLCIGCKLCIDACPTEAVIGSVKHLHAIDPDRCNGCCLCQLACPMDCIKMVRIDRLWDDALAAQSKARYLARNRRLAQRKNGEEARLNRKSLIDKKDFVASLLKKRIGN